MTTAQSSGAGGKHRRPRRRTGAIVAAVAVVAGVSVAAAIAVGAGNEQDGQGTARAEHTTPTSAAAEVEASLGRTTAQSMEAVEVSGRVAGVPAGTPVRVQMLHEDGRWRKFPLEPVTDESGAFSTYVEIGEPGMHRLRVVEPDSGARSKTFSLRIR